MRRATTSFRIFHLLYTKVNAKSLYCFLSFFFPLFFLKERWNESETLATRWIEAEIIRLTNAVAFPSSSEKFHDQVVVCGGASTFIDNFCKLQQYWSRFSSRRWVFTVGYLSIHGITRTRRLSNIRIFKYEVRVICSKCFYHLCKRAEHEICLHLSAKLHYDPDPV